MYLGFTIAFYLLRKIDNFHIYVYSLNKLLWKVLQKNKNIWMVSIIQE